MADPFIHIAKMRPTMELDEDEMYSFVLGNFNNCPYYKFGDEYTIVKKQI